MRLQAAALSNRGNTGCPPTPHRVIDQCLARHVYTGRRRVLSNAWKMAARFRSGPRSSGPEDSYRQRNMHASSLMCATATTTPPQPAAPTNRTREQGEQRLQRDSAVYRLNCHRRQTARRVCQPLHSKANVLDALRFSNQRERPHPSPGRPLAAVWTGYSSPPQRHLAVILCALPALRRITRRSR